METFTHFVRGLFTWIGSIIKRILDLDEPLGNASRFTNKNKKYTDYSIGDWTYGFPKVIRWGKQSTLRVGKFCSIAPEVVILIGAEHHTDWISTFPFDVQMRENDPTDRSSAYSKGDVVIGNDVWIGYGAMILSGVMVGDGAVIGAYSVITKDIPPYAVAAGNPAKIIRYRFDNQMIKKLLAIKWWDWPVEKVRAAKGMLLSDNLDGFIEKFGNPEIN